MKDKKLTVKQLRKMYPGFWFIDHGDFAVFWSGEAIVVNKKKTKKK